MCVVAGTHYIPIALPSILASLFLLLPLVAIAAKLQASGQEVTRAQMKIEELETELRVLKERCDERRIEHVAQLCVQVVYPTYAKVTSHESIHRVRATCFKD